MRQGGGLTTIKNYTTLKLSLMPRQLFISFDYHKELHYSQTKWDFLRRDVRFDYHKELHYSQTQTFLPSKEPDV